MNEDSQNFGEWLSSMTVSDFANVMLLVTFGLLIVVFVVRTFRDSDSA